MYNLITSFLVYVGGMGCLWSIFWIFLVFDSPEKHPRIEEAELKYIQASLAGIGGKVRCYNNMISSRFKMLIQNVIQVLSLFEHRSGKL